MKEKNLLVSIKNLSKDFYLANQKNRVLKNIDLQINRKEVTMIVGPSGCGKTTMLSIITGILTPSEGEILIDGKNIFAMNSNQQANFRLKNIGFIFQQYNLLPALSSLENVALPLIASGVDYDNAIKKSKQILDEVDMSSHLDKIPSQLSGGQQQRIAIARALVNNPALIICDEPTSALDFNTGSKVIEILHKFCATNNSGVVIVTHDSRILKFADKIIHLEDGILVKQEDKNSFTSYV